MKKKNISRTINLITKAQNKHSIPLDLDDDVETIVMRTFAGKKTRMIFYTQRELLLFSNGNFSYKRKNKSEIIKLTIEPKDILKMHRSNNLLTISTNNICAEDGGTPENSFIFKFANESEAKEWWAALDKYKQ